MRLNGRHHSQQHGLLSDILSGVSSEIKHNEDLGSKSRDQSQASSGEESDKQQPSEPSPGFPDPSKGPPSPETPTPDNSNEPPSAVPLSPAESILGATTPSSPISSTPLMSIPTVASTFLALSSATSQSTSMVPQSASLSSSPNLSTTSFATSTILTPIGLPTTTSLSTTTMVTATASPIPQVLQTTSPSSTPRAEQSAAGGLSNSNKIGLGVGLGLGLPVLIFTVAALFMLWRRKRRSHEIMEDAPAWDSERPLFQGVSEKSPYGTKPTARQMSMDRPLPDLPPPSTTTSGKPSKRQSRIAPDNLSSPITPVSALPPGTTLSPKHDYDTSRPVSPVSAMSDGSELSSLHRDKSVVSRVSRTGSCKSSGGGGGKG